MKNKIIAVIPARGSSKRIPDKNIKPFLGKFIISYSIETAMESEIFDKIIVSTDSERIAKVAQKAGADVPFIRPAHISDDYSPLADVAYHVLQFLKDQSNKICLSYFSNSSISPDR